MYRFIKKISVMATKINSFGITKLTLAAHAQFHMLISTLITGSDLEALHLTTLAPQYLAATAAEKEIVNRPSAYTETPELIAIDHNRDLAVSLAFNLIDTFMKSPNQADQSAATFMHAIVAPYRDIQGHEYNRETSEITGLIEALSAAPTDKINLLALSSPIELMDTYNAAFIATKAERYTDIAARTPIAEADTRERRGAADTLYKQIVEQTNAYATIAPTAEITAFISTVNSYVAEYKIIVANQGKQKPTGIA